METAWVEYERRITEMYQELNTYKSYNTLKMRGGEENEEDFIINSNIIFTNNCTNNVNRT